MSGVKLRIQAESTFIDCEPYESSVPGQTSKFGNIRTNMGRIKNIKGCFFKQTHDLQIKIANP